MRIRTARTWMSIRHFSEGGWASAAARRASQRPLYMLSPLALSHFLFFALTPLLSFPFSSILTVHFRAPIVIHLHIDHLPLSYRHHPKLTPIHLHSHVVTLLQPSFLSCISLRSSLLSAHRSCLTPLVLIHSHVSSPAHSRAVTL
jgi:hypothetical protein